MKSIAIMKKTGVAVLLTMLVVSCAPVVTTDMYTHEWPATVPDSVHIFALGEKRPPRTIAIGEVTVKANPMLTNASFSHMTELAVEATAKNGGNGLIITSDRMPDMFRSTCRLQGTMLHLPQEAVAQRNTDDSLREAHLQATLTDEEYADYKEYRAARQQYEVRRQAYEAEERKMEEQRKNTPRNILRVNCGPSWMTSEYWLDNHRYKGRTGFDLLADYDHVWKSGFGFGINYLHNHTSYPEGVKTNLNYLGPSFVMAFSNNHTRLDMAIGLGYSHYDENYRNLSESVSRLGAFYRIGLEYSIMKNLAIGIQLHFFSMSLKEPKEVELKDNEFYGIQHIGLHAGLRYYF